MKPKRLKEVPKVKASREIKPAFEGFPLEHYSYSTFQKFSTNAFMFKVNAINGDSLETTSSPTNIIGRAGHYGVQTYLGGNEEYVVPANNDGEAMTIAFEAARKHLESYSDGFINYGKEVPNRQSLEERFAFGFLSYLKSLNFDPKKQQTIIVEKMLKYRVNVDGRELPVPLKGSPDWVYRDLENGGRIVIHDHKFTTKFSSPDAIDGSKLIQAIFNYLLVYAETGEAPYKMVFAEHKIIKNADAKEPQTRFYEMIFDELPLAFDLFFRFYEDVTDALLGKMVYVPNIMAIFDREVSILAYIHRLDVDEVRAKQLSKLKVDNITDFLKKKIQKEGSMRRYLEEVATKFISADTLNYSTMKTEEKIKMKLAEHGIGVEFHSKVEGPMITLYRYTPSIGVKMSRVESFNKDVEQVTAATGVRVLAPIPGTDMIGFEVPNTERTFLGKAPAARALRIAVGVDIQGNVQYIDLNTAPHVLIAGTTGGGKSVTTVSMVRAIGGSADLWLMDPKKVELSGMECHRYGDTPEEIELMLKALVKIMEDRYSEMKKRKEKNWSGRKIVAVIDEFGDLVMNGKGKGSSISHLIVVLAQKARAAGIHMIITTQHPTVKIIDGAIKANFPTRIALKTASPKDSEVILGYGGAEKLTGKGDALLMRSDSSVLTRIQAYSE